jgi:hypothetical protein
MEGAHRDDHDRAEVVCLACGTGRLVSAMTPDGLGTCPKCEYIGWAPRSEIADGDLLARPRPGFY